MNALVEEVRAELHLIVPLVDPSGLSDRVLSDVRTRIELADTVHGLQDVARDLIAMADHAAYSALEWGEVVRFDRACLAAKELHILLVALRRLEA